jgi:hypothetical protein
MYCALQGCGKEDQMAGARKTRWPPDSSYHPRFFPNLSDFCQPFCPSRKTAERELEAIHGHQERVEKLEQDKDAILEHYAGTAPEALDSLAPEERNQVYRMLRIKVVVHVDGTLEVSGPLVALPALVIQERHKKSVLHKKVR